MVCFRVTVCGVCGADVDSCEDRDRRGEFESRDGDSDDGGSRDGMGNGFSDACAEWDWIDLATGASWLCYYRALQIGEASKVVPIDKLSVVITLVLAFVLLHEEVSVKAVAGCVLIGAGTLVMVL